MPNIDADQVWRNLSDSQREALFGALWSQATLADIKKTSLSGPPPVPSRPAIAVSQTDMSMWARILGGIRSAFGGQGSQASSYTPTRSDMAPFQSSFMGPGEPRQPLFGSDVVPRRYDYPPSQNIIATPRSGLVTYDQLQQLSMFDPARYCLEARKNRIKAKKWAVVPRDEGEGKSGKFDEAIAELTKYWSYPDGQNTFDHWVSRLLEDSFVLGPSTVYRWPNKGGTRVFKHVGLSAKYWVPLLDAAGGTPAPPFPAYMQWIKGTIYKWATTDELIFAERNPTNDTLYPMSEIEWLLFEINIALRRDTYDLGYYTDGNIPAGFAGTPENWTPEQVKAFNEYFNDLMTAPVEGAKKRVKMIFLPGGFTVQRFIERDEEKYVKFWEFIIRRCCAIFQVSPEAYISRVNRATAETAAETQESNADEPLLQWVEAIITKEIQVYQGQPELEFKFVSEQRKNELEEANRKKVMVESGQRSIDETREEDGLPAFGIPPFVMGAGGPVYLRGSDPEYQKRYAKFFEMQDAEAQKKQEQALETMRAKALPPGPPGQDGGGGRQSDPKQAPGNEANSQKPDKSARPAAAAIAAELRKWRKVALTKRDRPFTTEALPLWMAERIKASLGAATTPSEIRQIFTSAIALVENGGGGAAKAAGESPAVAELRARAEARFADLVRRLLDKQKSAVIEAVKNLSTLQ